MKRFTLDTSAVIAAVCAWHERHDQTATAIERRLRRGERLTLPAHALLESYAVLTRLPAPHRLAPHDAWAVIHGNFVGSREVIALDAGAYTDLLAELSAAGIGGGRSYDALIARSAVQAKAGALLTLNARHFQPAPDGLVIEEPS